jgi:hypothetical protein
VVEKNTAGINGTTSDIGNTAIEIITAIATKTPAVALPQLSQAPDQVSNSCMICSI